MRNIVFGLIGLVWGAAIIVSRLVNGIPTPDNSYGAGQFVGFLLGFALVGAGTWALRNGVRSRRPA